jgi:hypothetical protein
MIKDENTQSTAMGQALSNAGATGKAAGQAQPDNSHAASAGFNPTATPSGKPMGFSSLGFGIDAPIPLNNTGEVLTSFQRAIQTLLDSYKQDTSPVVTTLIPVERNDGVTNLPVSYLIVCTQLRSNKEAGVGYQALIIEGSIDQILTTEEYVPGAPGGKVTVERTAADADVPKVRETVNNLVKARFQTEKVFPAIAMVVPKNFTENLTDPQRVKNLTARVTYAASLALHIGAGLVKPLNLKEFIGGGDALQAKLSFDSRSVQNVFNMPVASHAKIDLLSEPVAKSEVPGFGSGGSTKLATISAVLDVIYQPKTPSTSVAGLPMFGTPTADMYKKFIPRVVLTMLQADRLMTLGGQMLALAAAVSIRERGLWMGMALPQRDVPANEIDLRDFGVLNREVNFGGDPSQPGAPLDIKADSFTNGHLMTYLKTIFHDGNPVFAVDVSLRGPDTSYNGALAAADDGDPGAEKAVLNALNIMTNGEFARRWVEGTPVTLRKGENIHLGHYTKPNGEVVDLRTLDNYIAVQNLAGGSAPDLVRDYSDTYLKTSYPEAQRMAARLVILRKLAPNLVITGTARRVSFHGKTIDTLVEAMAAIQASIPVTGNTYVDTGTADRAVGDFLSGLTSADSSTVYSRQFAGAAASGAVGGNQYAGAWQ